MNQLHHYEVISKFSTYKSLWDQLYFILSWIEYADNIGHFIRLSESLGLYKILLCQCNVTSKALSVARNSSVEIMTVTKLEQYIEQSCDIFYAVEITTSSIDYKHITVPNNQCWIGLIMWSERHGIDESILSLVQDHVHVPMYGQNSSMNVSHAWAIVAYEIASKVMWSS